MIKRCKNCAGRVTYDIDMKGLYCESCGSLFTEAEFESVLDEYEEYPMLDVPKEETINCNVYQCSSCGAEISVTDTEASTFCIYCGNPTIVFSRVSKMKKPDAIIPFKVTKEEAMDIVRSTIKKGFFVPKEIKNYKIEQMRGIYIPYYVTSVEYDGSILFSSTVKSGKSSKTIYSKRSAYASMEWLTTDASTTLADSTSQRLEPYYKNDAVPFDENYLVGFYSDMSDVLEVDAVRTAKGRARELARAELEKTVKGSSKKVLRSREDAEVYEDVLTAMFPAWFLTFRYKDKPYTVIVNGQTGKLVGGVPWNKGLFIGLVVAASIVFSVACVFLSSLIASVVFPTHRSHSSSSNNNSGRAIAIPIVAAISSITAGVKKIRKVMDSIARTSASTLTSYVSKRQKGQ